MHGSVLRITQRPSIQRQSLIGAIGVQHMAVMRAVTTSLHSLRVTGTASNELVLGGKLGDETHGTPLLRRSQCWTQLHCLLVAFLTGREGGVRSTDVASEPVRFSLIQKHLSVTFPLCMSVSWAILGSGVFCIVRLEPFSFLEAPVLPHTPSTGSQPPCHTSYRALDRQQH